MKSKQKQPADGWDQKHGTCPSADPWPMPVDYERSVAAASAAAQPPHAVVSSSAPPGAALTPQPSSAVADVAGAGKPSQQVSQHPPQLRSNTDEGVAVAGQPSLQVAPKPQPEEPVARCLP